MFLSLPACLSSRLYFLCVTCLLGGWAFAATSEESAPDSSSTGSKGKCFTRQELTARGGGFLVRVAVAEGSMVKHGYMIAELDNRVLKAAKKEAEAGVMAAKASLAMANDGWERLKKLAKTDTVAPSELFNAEMMLEKAKAGLMQAEAVLDRVRSQLDDTRIVAELEGQVSGLPHVKGLYIQPGGSLGHIEVKSSGCKP